MMADRGFPAGSGGPSASRWSRTGTVLGAAAAALGAAVLYNSYRTRQVERRHPPTGRFVEVDGVRLHYLERGAGTPVVLIHGNVVTAEDWILSGVLDQVAAQGHRVIAFDRPGYGYSDRPRGTAWTATAQADLLRRAFARLGLECPVVVGHSWGTLAALALALADPTAVRGLVLVSGYYHPTVRADALLVAPAAVPVLGDVLRHTVSPLFGAATLPLLLKGMFAPLPLPERFQQGFERGMAVRPLQIRAEAEDGAGMAREAATMRDRYGELHLPVMIMAGSDDQVVDVGRHAVRLHQQIPHSELRLFPGAGHMVHYAVPEQVAEMIEAAASGHRIPGGPELAVTRPAGTHDRQAVAAE
jgi:pimeloyl-ACP methyl ester carboxylesterase